MSLTDVLYPAALGFSALGVVLLVLRWRWSAIPYWVPFGLLADAALCNTAAYEIDGRWQWALVSVAFAVGWSGLTTYHLIHDEVRHE